MKNRIEIALAGLVACLALWLGVGCARPSVSAPADDLLRNAVVRAEVGVHDATRLTDGVRANDGDYWRTDLTAQLASAHAWVELDLGQVRPIGAAYLQGDGDDTYVVSISSDGKAFTPLWEARASSASGMRDRQSGPLSASARYVRLSAQGGDGRYAVSELALFSARPAVFPPELPTRTGIPLEVAVRTKLLVFGFALGLLALLAPPRDSKLRWLGFLLAGAAALAGGDFVRQLQAAWPPDGGEVSLVRAVAAGVACLVLLREAFGPKRFAPDRRIGSGLLALSAALALASFYDLGHPQFVDHRDGGPRFVHDFDMRVYYPVAKYWKELRYDGLYLASAAAFADDDPKAFRASLGKTEIRNLENFRVQKLGESLEQMARVKARFSSPRWDAFRTDMRYFRQTMGERDYVGSMLDHGANATPVWITIAHLIFGWTHASDATLMFGAALDPILLVIAFIAIGRTFGLRIALLAMVVFGANDFYMTGSNWAGSTLRHDWLALLALGISALAKERWRTAGALLTLAALIRAFPALALAGVAIPSLFWLIARARSERPTLRAFMKAQQPLVQIVVGAAITGVLAWLISSVVCGFGAWPAWFVRTAEFNASPAPNEISLRFFLSGGDTAPRLLASRQLLHGICLAGFVVAVLVSARRTAPHRAAVLALLLTPVLFNPTNYYLHLVYLVPLLAVGAAKAGERAGPMLAGLDAGIVVALLLMCALQYLAIGDKDEVHHFWVENCLYWAWLPATLWLAAKRGEADRAQLDRPYSSSG